MTQHFLRSIFLATLAFLVGCEPPTVAPDPLSMDLLLIRPKNTSGVYLNEPLMFDFSHEIDPTSVTMRSVRIELADGTPARGKIRVEGRRVIFEPADVLSPKLNDGGYLPGQRYTVTLLGFPAPDAVRGTGGEPLRKTGIYDFTTVKDVTWPREDFVFADDTPQRCAPLFVLRDHIAPRDDSILLGCEEPLDPSSLFADDFVLRGQPDTAPIPMRVRLIRNGNRSDRTSGAAEVDGAGWQAAAVLELQPLESLDGARDFTLDGRLNVRTQRGPFGSPNLSLEIAANLRLADFSGNPVPVSLSPAFNIYIEDESPASDRIQESFLTTQRRLPIPIAGVDGTAHWGNDGTVRVRYPRAAGSGRDGDVLLGSTSVETRADIHAVELHVGKEGCDLGSRPGLRVLRSQGRMVIAGPLRRATELEPEGMRWRLVEDPKFRASSWLAEAAAESSESWWTDLNQIYARSQREPSWNDLRDWFDLAGRELLRPNWEDFQQELTLFRRGGPDAWSSSEREVVAWYDRVRSDAESGTTLSGWLDRARISDKNWTVLIAGGDLVIEGSIETDTPVLLVAGGMIRIRGEVHAGRLSGSPSEELYLLGEGGGISIQRRDAPLEIDPPQHNQLVRSMSFGVLSKQIPQEDGPIHWASAVELGSSPRVTASGTLNVSYVRGVPAFSFDPAEAELFEDPSLMAGPGPVHFFILIEVPKAPESTARGLVPWNPPFLDEIILTVE